MTLEKADLLRVLSSFGLFVLGAVALTVILWIVLFRKDHYKLGIVMPLNIISFAVAMLFGKQLIVQFAVDVSGLKVTGGVNEDLAGPWPYVAIIAFLSGVAALALFFKNRFDIAQLPYLPPPNDQQVQ
ncbi:hypothetical protein [Sinorhizobium meliloti]|uniref:hypothetical protein n=1 Tax=Rhizobium meliloti TaxID=382 RepID=UPI000FE02C81|nr:hypothetical protein [Sinorhizobium meliloti]MDX0470277.1 hypothetical protein [Sinorhizobium medicae]MDX0716525.1 hypothetical protein [Sinorhizobium medicae]MDX0846189.1 hypothetical protein [Sinorhizobium medicae]MDX1177373.1 hypothetical protein [Sinorhizobium medicae]MDX1250254.1 hypothetical protein [Sinorhizobium medicae]